MQRHLGRKVLETFQEQQEGRMAAAESMWSEPGDEVRWDQAQIMQPLEAREGLWLLSDIGGSGQSGYVDRTLWMGGEVVRKSWL